jgi:diguanylate cyclase (GGDEF)-like protein
MRLEHRVDRTEPNADPTVNLHVRIAELEERNRTLERELESLRLYKDYAYTDVLTGIPNRRMYEERLRQELARAERGRHALALALIDLDGLKSVNDNAGHGGGDEVLRRFAQLVRSGLREPDTFCRIGGDEFAVILPDTSAANAGISIERLRHKLSELELCLEGGNQVQLSFSCGIAEFEPRMDSATLMQQADSALYDAKARGRNRSSTAIGPGAVTSTFVH